MWLYEVPMADVGRVSVELSRDSVADVLEDERRGFFSIDKRLKQRLPRMVLATIFMALALWGVNNAISKILYGSTEISFGSLLALIFTGIIVYGVSARILGALYYKDLKSFWRSHN